MTSTTPSADAAAAPGPSLPSRRRGTMPTENRLTFEELHVLRENDRQAVAKIRQYFAEEQAVGQLPAPGSVGAQPAPFAPRARGAPVTDRLSSEELEALRADARAAKAEIRRRLAALDQPKPDSAAG